jgi:uncharacterized protein YeaO (DUF488 family)
MTSHPSKTTRKPPAKRTPTRVKSASIRIKRVYEDASASDGLRILIDRLWPRGLSKAKLKYAEWVRDLAPSNDLRKWYNHDPKRWAEFRRRYLSELAAHRDELEALRAKLKRHTVTLLTATHAAELSHAVVLREVLSEKKRAPRRVNSKE